MVQREAICRAARDECQRLLLCLDCLSVLCLNSECPASAGVLIEQDIKVLRGIPPPSQPDALHQVKATLDVKSVRDLALYPPYVAALVILDQAHPVADAEAAPDPEAPPELLPKVGHLPDLQVAWCTVQLAPSC